MILTEDMELLEEYRLKGDTTSQLIQFLFLASTIALTSYVKIAKGRLIMLQFKSKNTSFKI